MAARSVFPGRTSSNGTCSFVDIIPQVRPFCHREGEKNMNNNGNLAENIETAKRHILFHHDPANTTGWITIAKKDPHTHKFHQYHYQPEEMAEKLSEWMGEDVYFSQQTFFKPRRAVETIRQLRSLYVDLDVYNKGLDAEWVLGKLELEYFGQSIPDPNMVIFSGRGLVLIWNIEPVPYMALPLWRAVENHLISSLKDLGSDPKASDPARIFRIAGTVNSKVHTLVKAEYRHAYRYDIHQIQYDYLPELRQDPAARRKPGRKPKIIQLFNIYTLHISRARDIARLVELRDGEVGDCREYMCFLYRYFTCCFTDDPAAALEATMELNSEFRRPLPEKEILKATRSAEKAWRAKSSKAANEAAKAMGYPGAGYNIKNSDLIDWLNITPEEEEQLTTIISKRENRRREKVRRHEEGMLPREEYLKQQQEQTMSKVDLLKNYMAESPGATNKELAEKMGCTVRTIQRLKAKIG